MNLVLDDDQFRVPAGLLALTVHAVFFVLLYFGFTWQTQAVRSISVELWSSLPEVVEVKTPPPEVAKPVEPEPPKPIEPVVENKPAVQPRETVKPDIAMPEKKKPKVEVKPLPPTPAEIKAKEKARAEQVAREKAAAEQAAAQKAAEQAAQKAAEQAAQDAREKAILAAREQAALNAARNALVDEYKARIIATIRRNIVKPPDVRDDALTIFNVTLLPGGGVMRVERAKPSGNPAYDDAVERAIRKSDPLPLPPDATLFPRFRELRMTFRPTE
jgi:colicin import membrane protein